MVEPTPQTFPPPASIEEASEPKSKTFAGQASIGDGIKTLLLSLIAYSTLFAFECGYCDWFRIPHDFIRFDVTRFLICATALITFLMFVMNLAQLAFGTLRKWYSKERKLMRFFAPVIMVCLGLMLFVLSYFEWTILWIYAGIGCFGQLVLALQLLRSKGSFRERLAAMFAKQSPNALGTVLGQKYGYFWQILAFCLLILLMAAYYAGRGEARRQSKYLVLSENKSLVVLRVYGDRAICAPLISAQELEPSFSVWDINQGSKLTLRLQWIGPLSMSSR